MEFGWITIVHVVAAALAFLTLILSAVVAARTDTIFTAPPGEISFVIFCSIWSILVLGYIGAVPVFFQRAYHNMVAFGLLVVTTIFWFAGAIAFAVLIGSPTSTNDTVRTAQAAIAFSFFLWLIFTALTVLEGLALFRGRSMGGATAHGIGGPKP